MICTTYVQSLPYGRICDAAGGWQINSLLGAAVANPNLNYSKIISMAHDPSKIGISLGGTALLPNWPGGCYNVTLSNLEIEMASAIGASNGNSWGIFNVSCEESTFADGIVVSDALGGAYYSSGPGVQNSNHGYIHTTGSQADYTITELIENTTAFHSVSDLSVGAQIGTPWLARSGLMVKQDYVFQGGAIQAEIHSPQGESVLEGVTVENASATVINRYGRSVSPPSNRWAIWGVHFDQYSPAVKCELCWSASAGPNIQDDVVAPYGNGTTSAATAPTILYARDEAGTGGIGGLGPASPNGFIVNSDISGYLQAPTLVSNAATGTAPLTVTSTTPVANLAATPTTYNASGSQQANAHVVIGSCTLASGSCSVSLTSPATFNNATSYSCTAEDRTAPAATRVQQINGSSFMIFGSSVGSDVVGFVCVGD